MPERDTVQMLKDILTMEISLPFSRGAKEGKRAGEEPVVQKDKQVEDILKQFRHSVEVIPFHNYQYKYRDSKNKSGTEYLILAMESKS